MSAQLQKEAWVTSHNGPANSNVIKGRLLLSIADRYLATLLEAVLEREGYKTAATPIEAVELSTNKIHDLLVTDAETLLNISNLPELTRSIRILALDWGERGIPAPLAREVTVVNPLRTDLLLATVDYLCEINRLERENQLLRRALSRNLYDDGSEMADAPEGGPTLSDRVDQYEKNLIISALRRTQGSQVRAAQLLGVKTTTLNMKLKRYGINALEYRQPLALGAF